MPDRALLRERLESVLEALERIPRRCADIRSAGDFTKSEQGKERLDGICMVLIAVGEAFKRIDRKTEGKLLAGYPEVEWAGVKGVRDVIAHGYFEVDVEEVFSICQTDVPVLIKTVRRMIEDLR
ncbi:MAG: DUF86 domain-containing protein [Nitrospinae bacterium]|nr:DUF86 domain-containing protein [Nitrospinota bacterium]